jgi:hypothetical protein
MSRFIGWREMLRCKNSDFRTGLQDGAEMSVVRAGANQHARAYRQFTPQDPGCRHASKPTGWTALAQHGDLDVD